MFTAAVENSQIVILYFGNREDDDEFFSGIDVAEMAKAGLVLCVRVREPEVKGDKPVAIVPTSRLAADDKWAAYGIEKADTFIVADRYGNEYKRTDKCELADATKEVGAHFRKVRKELRKNCADAETAIADGKTADALTALREALKTGVVGYDEANKAVELYNKLIEDGRKAMKGADAAKLKQLAETYKDTDLATEIAEASKKVNN